MALTAIVIGLAVTALLLTLVLRVVDAYRARDLDEVSEEEAERDARLEREDAARARGRGGGGAVTAVWIALVVPWAAGIVARRSSTAAGGRSAGSPSPASPSTSPRSSSSRPT